MYWNNCSFRTLLSPIFQFNSPENIYIVEAFLPGLSQQWNKYFITNCTVTFDNTNAPSLKQLPFIWLWRQIEQQYL